MASHIHTTIVGHLGADPEIRYTQAGEPVLKARIAVNVARKDRDGNWQDRTLWWSVTQFGDVAKRNAEKMAKGNLVLAEGRMDASVWTTQDGEPRIYLDLVASTFRSLERAQRSEEDQEPEPARAAAPRSAPSRTAAPASEALGDLEDLPF